jgi:hypothetical protein
LSHAPITFLDGFELGLTDPSQGQGVRRRAAPVACRSSLDVGGCRYNLCMEMSWASAVAKSAATVGSGVLAADRRRDRRRDRRAAAYQRFYEALIAASVLLNDIKSTLPYYRRLPTSLWLTPRLHRTLDRGGEVLRDLLSALAEVRTFGEYEPRALAEKATALAGELADTLPTASRPRLRDEQQERFERLLHLLGETQRDFTAAVRRDLRFDRPLRTRWWQVWRPRQAAPWPGGWPVPPPTVEG